MLLRPKVCLQVHANVECIGVPWLKRAHYIGEVLLDRHIKHFSLPCLELNVLVDAQYTREDTLDIDLRQLERRFRCLPMEEQWVNLRNQVERLCVGEDDTVIEPNNVLFKICFLQQTHIRAAEVKRRSTTVLR